jgi:hypothetical protein
MNNLILLAIVGVVGLISMQYTHGYLDPKPFMSDPELYNLVVKYNEVEELLNYCYEHATDKP